MNRIVNFFEALFPKKKKSSPIIVPTVLVGSPDYQTPSIYNEDGNWFAYFTTPYNNQEETLPNNSGLLFEDNCTVESSIAIIQAILNYYLVNNLFPENVTTFLKTYYCNAQGQVKLSVRYSSKMANIQQGIGANYGDVWNQYNVNGIVPEKNYPDPKLPFTWAEYMAEIDPEIIKLGKLSTTFFQILWQAIPNNGWGIPNIQAIQKALTTSPVGICGSIGTIDKNGVEQYNGQPIYEHARVIGAVDDKNMEFDILDNYPGPNGLLTRRMSLNFPQPCMVIAQVRII